MQTPKPEIIRNRGESREFLGDVKSFAHFLDNYRIAWAIDREEKGKFVYLDSGTYRVLDSEEAGAYQCPECGNSAFEVMEGQFDGKPALGLACTNCESYGAIFPAGLN